MKMLLAALVVAAILPQDPPKAALEWKWAKGATLRYDLDMVADVDVGGMPVKQDQTLGLVLEVTAVGDDGAAELKVLIDRVRAVMNGMMEADYDSDRDAEPDTSTVSQFMAALKGQSFTMKIGRSGKVTDLKGLSDVVKAAVKEHGEGSPVLAHLEKLLADRQVRGMLQQLFIRLPDAPVAAGDSWKSEASWSLPILGSFILSNEAKLKEFRNGGKEAAVSVKIKAAAGADEANEAEVDDVEASATAVWSVEHARLVSSACQLSMTANLSGQECQVDVKTKLAFAPRDPKTAPKPTSKPKPPVRKEE